jgi:predicted aspartyl protease
MGRTIVTFELSNYRDMALVDAGYLTPDKIRRVSMQGVVDTGSARLVLPEGVARLLGLPVTGRSTVRYADHRRETRDVVSDAYVRLEGRGGVFNAVVEPARSDALLGAIVLEDLDLLVDSTGQRVVPRDPNTIITEVE